MSYRKLCILFCLVPFRWVLQHKALRELEAKFFWLRAMINAIALKLVGDVGWGLKFRVFVGAALSTLDLITDIFITYTFWKNGEQSLYKISLSMILTSIFLSLFTIWGSNRKRATKLVLQEIIPVVLGLKPAVDAFRVARGVEIEEGQ